MSVNQSKLERLTSGHGVPHQYQGMLAGSLSTEEILSLPEAPEGYEFLTNTTDYNWKSWCGRNGAVMARPKATKAKSCEEFAKQGSFGLYAPRRTMDAAHTKMFAVMASLPQDQPSR
jgi:hypothetical protein